MLCFSTWITLLILIGSVWSQTPGTEPSARLLKFGGGALLESVRVKFCDTSCKHLGRLLFIRNISCFVNCPELWRPSATTKPAMNGMGSNSTTTKKPITMPSTSSTTPKTTSTMKTP